jgi:methyl-accepting chemotaxis protein
MVRELQSALAGGRRDEARELFDRLEEFSTAHFLAEQLMMRLHAYPALAAHEDEHGRLVAELRALRRTLDDDEALDSAAAVARLERWLFAHMNSHDHELAEYLDATAGDGGEGAERG